MSVVVLVVVPAAMICALPIHVNGRTVLLLVHRDRVVRCRNVGPAVNAEAV